MNFNWIANRLSGFSNTGSLTDSSSLVEAQDVLLCFVFQPITGTVCSNRAFLRRHPMLWCVQVLASAATVAVDSSNRGGFLCSNPLVSKPSDAPVTEAFNLLYHFFSSPFSTNPSPPMEWEWMLLKLQCCSLASLLEGPIDRGHCQAHDTINLSLSRYDGRLCTSSCSTTCCLNYFHST